MLCEPSLIVIMQGSGFVKLIANFQHNAT